MVMFRSMNTEEHFSKGRSWSTSTSLEAATESPVKASFWINTLAAVSRPAWMLLNKYLPGRTRTWSSDGGNVQLDFGRSLVAGLGLDNQTRSGNDLTRLRVAYVHCQHKNAEFIDDVDSDVFTCFTPETLSEFTIQNIHSPTKHTPQMGNGYFKTIRNFLSQLFLNMGSTQKKVEQSNLEVLYPNTSRDPNICCWHGYLGSNEEVPPSFLCQTSISTDAETSLRHCELDSKVSLVVDSKPMELCMYSSLLECMGCECSRPSESKDNGSLHIATLQSPPGLPSAYTHCVVGQEIGVKTAAVFSEVLYLSPDQDHGYCSLEEEGAKTRQSSMNICEKLLKLGNCVACQAGGHKNGGEEDKPLGNNQYEGEKIEDKQLEENSEEKEGNVTLEYSTRVTEASLVQSIPHCSNKAIAYIIGGSFNDESDWEDSEWESDDDDGFDSEVSSDFSDSADDDDKDTKDSESDELDSESQRLLDSLCHTGDPYNPRNFTAPIRTLQKPSAAETHLSPLGSPAEPEPFLSPSAPASLIFVEPQENGESSEEACLLIDEAESLTLWNYFSSSLDPYSPLNFTAPIRTREPAMEHFKKENHAGSQLCRKEEAEERMDSGFPMEASDLKSIGCVRLKKVKFVEEVEEFYASSDEERHGPWEELARDRCRFQRRIQEVEDSISYCMSPTFRFLTFQRLYPSC